MIGPRTTSLRLDGIEANLIRLDEACPYLRGREAVLEGFFTGRVESSMYRLLMEHGFRRSGRFFYRPACEGCNECVSLRVVPHEFRASRAQRRCLKRNSDLMVEVGPPVMTAEKHELYGRYQRGKHGSERENEMGALWDFLYNPVVDSLEFCYRDRAGNLLAVGICDLFADALSTVYCFYEPDQRRRGLGTFTALHELRYAAQQGLAYYFMGYYVGGCPAMSYKASYRPHQLLNLAGPRTWTRTGQKAEVPG